MADIIRSPYEVPCRIADAVLHEGYVLYSYPASSTMDRVRWQFGMVASKPPAQASGERWFAQTEHPMAISARVLVAGIGNVFFADDGFGVEVVRRLAATPLPEHVRVMDAGIRGVHLAYELADGGYELAILVDAMPRGGAPGTLYVLEPERAGAPDAGGHEWTWPHAGRGPGAPRTAGIAAGAHPAGRMRACDD